jgi:hypothetical protein
MPAMPPMSVVAGAGVPAAGVLRRGTMGGGFPVALTPPVPISVLCELPEAPACALGKGGGGRELSVLFALAFASARARAASSMTARAPSGRAEASVVWISAAAAAFAGAAPPALDAALVFSPEAAAGGEADGDVVFASPS